MQLPILFADRRFVVVDKAAGLACHPGRLGGASVEDYLPQLWPHRPGPWLAHRLDTDTAGCLVVALRHAALMQAQAAFAQGQAGKVYWAVVIGTPPATSGVITARLRKRNTPHGWRVVVDAAGQAAETAWELRGVGDGMAWLEMRPRTGRTHQVRVHCAALGCPVLGDAVYGTGGGKLHLLARAITLPLTPPLTATAPVPAFMQAALRRCGWDPLSPAETTGER